jgi:predicted nucleic acid-binding protein
MSLREVLEIRSDDLTHLRPLLESSFKDGGEMADRLGWGFQIVVIPDANRIIKDLIWLADRRENSEARTRLQEVIDAETVIAIAPAYLKSEMERKIPDVAGRAEVSEERLWEEWERYRPRIDFREPSLGAEDIGGEVQDPKDVPYVALQQEIGAPIYSDDEDIGAMGGAVVRERAIKELQEYARADSVRLTVLFNSSVAGSIGIDAIRGAFSLLRQLYLGFRKLPPWVQITIGVGALYAVTRNEVQERVQSFFDSMSGEGLKVLSTLVEDALLPLAEEITEVNERADQKLSGVRSRLPQTPSPHIRRRVQKWSDNGYSVVLP